MKKIAHSMIACGILLPVCAVIVGIVRAVQLDTFTIFVYYLLSALLALLVLVGEGLILLTAVQNGEAIRSIGNQITQKAKSSREQDDADAHTEHDILVEDKADVPAAPEIAAGVPMELGGGRIQCPKCGARQQANRTVCYECGCRFVSATDDIMGKTGGM